jgi:hypothetical protein
VVSCVLHLSDQLYYGDIPQPEKGRVVLAEVESVTGPVVLAPMLESSESAWLLLHLLERERRRPGDTGSILDPRLLQALREGATAPEAILAEATALARRATLLLVPAEGFRGGAEELRRRGLMVRERGTPGLRVLRVEREGATSDGP